MVAALVLSGCGGGGDDVALVNPTYTVAGAVSGLSGSGLVLTFNGGSDLAVVASGNFAFSPAIASGASYAVTVKRQPVNPSQTCVAANSAGTASAAAVILVSVSCTTDAYSVGGMVSGLTGTGLVLQLNGGQQVTVNGNGSFTFPNLELHGASYTVKVKTQTALQRELCTVSSGAAGNLSANVTNIKVSCAVVLGFVYVVDENRNVLEYGIQPQTGALVPVGPVASITGSTQHMVAAPDRRTLYVSDYISSAIHTFSVDQSKGSLTALGAPLVIGSSPLRVNDIAITPSGKFLYVSNPTDGTVALLTIDPATGAPTVQGVAATPSVPRNSAHQPLAITPDGAYLYALSVSLNGGPASLTAYAINPTTGALTARATLTSPVGEGLAIDPQGRFVYLWDDIFGPPSMTPSVVISPYAIDAGTGALTAVGGSTTLSSNGDEMVFEPSGRYAYMLGGFNQPAAEYHIDTLSIDQSTGALTTVGAPVVVSGEPTGGFALDATGSFLFTRNFRAAGALEPFADGSTFRIAQSGPTAGRASDAGTGATMARGDIAIAVIQ